MVLELRSLHLLNGLELDLGHVVLVHVQQDISYHIDAHLSFFPFEVEFFEEAILVSLYELIGNGIFFFHIRQDLADLFFSFNSKVYILMSGFSFNNKYFGSCLLFSE